MAIGLYRDLAVGAARDAAENWSASTLLAREATIGAPPDLYNREGQNWGLPPIRPAALVEDGYAHFIELLRANMRHAGALRIDMPWR
jgi:4-alpha-glucanotransferase